MGKETLAFPSSWLSSLPSFTKSLPTHLATPGLGTHMKFLRAFHFPLILTLASVTERAKPSLGNSLIWELGS